MISSYALAYIDRLPHPLQLFRDLAGEAAQLSLEYNEMHKNIQVNDTHTYLPECWAGLVPLKAELYKGELCCL